MKALIFYNRMIPLLKSQQVIDAIIDVRKIAQLSHFILTVDLRVAAAASNLFKGYPSPLTSSPLELFLRNADIPHPNRVTAFAWAQLCAPGMWQPKRDMCLVPTIPRMVDGTTSPTYRNLKAIRQLLPNMVDALINRNWTLEVSEQFVRKLDSKLDWGQLAVYSGEGNRTDPNHINVIASYDGMSLFDSEGFFVPPPWSHENHVSEWFHTFLSTYKHRAGVDDALDWLQWYHTQVDPKMWASRNVLSIENGLFDRWAKLNINGMPITSAPEWAIDSVNMHFTLDDPSNSMDSWVRSYYMAQNTFANYYHDLENGDYSTQQFHTAMLDHAKKHLVPGWRRTLETAFKEETAGDKRPKTKQTLDSILDKLGSFQL